jgi:xanthine dehydrogenase/oxidase
VEVNLLSGETRILAADLVYDAGKSLNAAVDVGQVKKRNLPHECFCVSDFLFFF